MKLELKYIAPYLPYGLNILLEISMNDSDLFSLDSNNIEGVIEYQRKPILRKLSDLTKEIEHNGEKFVPVEWFEIGDDDSGTEFDSGNIKTIKRLKDIAKHNIWHDIHYMPYALVNKLLEWNFDIYGLIDKGLAVDINTLNK